MQLFSATYKMRYGPLSGTMTMQLSRREDGYVYETSLRAAGVAGWFLRGHISEQTRLIEIDGSIRPVDYYSEDTIASPDRITSYSFDQPDGRVTGLYKSRLIDAPMKPYGQNRISMHIAIMRALQSDTEFSDYSVFDRGRWKDYQFDIVRNQRAKTPLGNFDTVEIRYSSPGSAKSWSLHCAPTLGYLPVMLVFREGGKIKSRALLTDYRIDDPDESDQ